MLVMLASAWTATGCAEPDTKCCDCSYTCVEQIQGLDMETDFEETQRLEPEQTCKDACVAIQASGCANVARYSYKDYVCATKYSEKPESTYALESIPAESSSGD